MESRLHFHVAIMKTSHDLTLERLKQGTIYHDTVRAISLSHLTCKIGRARARYVSYVSSPPFFLFFFRKCKSLPVARRERGACSIQQGQGNKLKRTNGDTKMTFKFGRGENDRYIHMWRIYTLGGASRVIAWYSDTKKLSFAFIPRRIRAHLFRINGPLSSRRDIPRYRCYYICPPNQIGQARG